MPKRLIQQNPLSLIGLAVATLMLGASIFWQYVEGIPPCRLCKIQRILVIGIMAGYLLELTSPWPRAFQLLAMSLWLASLLTGLYHAGVQMGLVADPCTTPRAIGSLQDFRSLLAKPTNCSAISLRVLGLPAPAANSLIAAIFGGLSLRLFLKSTRLTRSPSEIISQPSPGENP